MNKVSKQLKVGIVAIIALSMLIFGLSFLKGKNLFDNNRSFYAVYDNIGGLQSGSLVLVNGYQVGVVSDIDLLRSNVNLLIVSVNIDKEFNIPSNSILKIINKDLMGTKGVSLILGESSKLAENGDTLMSDIERSLKEEVNTQILPLKNKAEDLISSVDSVITVITTVLNKDARESLTKSLVSLDRTFSTMANTMDKVNAIVDDNDEKINNIIDDFSTISDEVAQADLASLISNLEEISSKINNSEGAIGLLIHEKEVYDNLEKATEELAELIEDIKKNPKRYINFFGTGKPYKKSK